MSQSKDPKPRQQELTEQDALSEMLREPSHTYVEKGKQLEDVTSTAWVFTFLGAAGVILIALLWTGLLPLEISFYFKVLSSIVLGGLFLFFLVTGIRAFQKRKRLNYDKAKEDTAICQITRWFEEHYSADALSNGMDEEDLSMEQLYFLRSENISRILAEQFGTMEESFLEHMTDKIYQMYFPD